MKPKNLRKAFRSVVLNRDRAYFDELFKRIFQMPLRDRVRFAWAVLRGRW